MSVDFDVRGQLLVNILHSSDTGEKMGLQLDTISPVFRLPGSRLFGSEGSTVQYSHLIWYTHGAG
jgi:hypothetical protein